MEGIRFFLFLSLSSEKSRVERMPFTIKTINDSTLDFFTLSVVSDYTIIYTKNQHFTTIWDHLFYRQALHL